MRTLLWVVVILVGVLGVGITLVSANFPAIQQAAVGSMVTALVVCAFAISYAVSAIKRS